MPRRESKRRSTPLLRARHNNIIINIYDDRHHQCNVFPLRR